MCLWSGGLLMLQWMVVGGEAVRAAANYEPYTFTHLAGSLGGPGYSDGTGSAARFNHPFAVAVDSTGIVYVADTYNHAIRKGWVAPRLTIPSDGSGGLFIRFQGAANLSYQLLRAHALDGLWTTNAVQTAPSSGLVEFHDLFPLPDRAFYRNLQE